MIDVAARLHEAEGFVGTLGPRVLSTGRDGAVLRLDAGPELHNHVGGPHAAAIFGLGETAAFAVLLEVFGEHGRHARSAVGVASLPMDAPVEVELIVEAASRPTVQTVAV